MVLKNTEEDSAWFGKCFLLKPGAWFASLVITSEKTLGITGIVYFLKRNNFHHKLSFIWIIWGSATQSSSNLLCFGWWALSYLKSSKTSKSQSWGELWRDVLTNDLGLLRDSSWIITCSLVIKHTSLMRPCTCSCWQCIQLTQLLVFWLCCLTVHATTCQIVMWQKKLFFFICKWVFNECVERVELWEAVL